MSRRIAISGSDLALESRKRIRIHRCTTCTADSTFALSCG